MENLCVKSRPGRPSPASSWSNDTAMATSCEAVLQLPRGFRSQKPPRSPQRWWTTYKIQVRSENHRKSRSFYGKSMKIPGRHVQLGWYSSILNAGYCHWTSRSQNGQVGLGNMFVTARWTSENIGFLTNYQTNPVSIPMALGSIMFNHVQSVEVPMFVT